VEIAIRFAEIALWGCMLNVRINTKEIKDAAARENLERELVALS
jgi:formiminotetrahydrofolate cyclodeaminase